MAEKRSEPEKKYEPESEYQGPSLIPEGSFYVDGPNNDANTRTAYFGSPQKRPRGDSLGGSENAASMRQFGMETLEQLTSIQDLKDKYVGETPLIWVDCDPGGDDCFALMWLFALEQKGHCKVLGISTADGNVSAPLTFAAADKVANLCGSKVKICAQSPRGARFGTREERRAARIAEVAKNCNSGDAAHIHGADGMGGLSAKLESSGNKYEDAEEAYEQIIETLLHYPRQVVLVCIGTFTVALSCLVIRAIVTSDVKFCSPLCWVGPLSNLADACDQVPGILMLSRDIVIMGLFVWQCLSQRLVVISLLFPICARRSVHGARQYHALCGV